ncbi:hypothetical protein C7E25_06565 [Stenotrophomonas maltophilia]|nr:hypothetical protein C7E24_12915 [Stenotrophomonas maltophilia]PSD50217.1 hypothetical protein C7E25_06565 [Stenotrophomonas maltophilia]
MGRCRSAGCQPHGCGCQAYRDVLAASPHSDTAAPPHGEPAFDFAVEVAGQRPALPRVQGCKPCRTTP